MAADHAVIADPGEAKAVTDDNVNAAVDAVLADRATEAYVLTDEYALNLNAAVQASTFASLILKNVHASQSQKRDAVRTAILLAHPVKG
ncbi:hypothetical protein [Methylobacterium fujisawaense]|uniref:hypothetical protein n=1 Tax=Methylobacterium fujisawaense TaxID=107400 RepID=UPI00313CED6D